MKICSKYHAQFRRCSPSARNFTNDCLSSSLQISSSLTGYRSLEMRNLRLLSWIVSPITLILSNWWAGPSVSGSAWRNGMIRSISLSGILEGQKDRAEKSSICPAVLPLGRRSGRSPALPYPRPKRQDCPDPTGVPADFFPISVHTSQIS